MAKQLSTVIASGDLTDYKKNGTGVGNQLQSKNETDDLIEENNLAAKDSILLTGQDTEPTHTEGLLFYENEHKTLTFMNDIDGFKHNLGYELAVRVFNDTGATLTNGTVVTTVATDAEGFLLAVPAIATSFEMSRAVGIITADIPDQSYGVVTRFGPVHGIDTNSHPISTPLYVSDTVAGEMTVTPPDIVSLVGYVALAGVDGTVFANVINNMELPTTFGQIWSKAGTMNLTITEQNITGYTNEDEIVVVADSTAGTLTPLYSGRYRITMSVTMTIPSSNQTRDIFLELYDLDDTTSAVTTTINVPKDSTQVSRTIGVPARLTANHSYAIRIWASTSISGVVFDEISLDIESIQISL